MRQRRLMNQINVVPYIDVMLVLLVIFMVTAPLIQTAAIDLPTVGKAAQPPAEPIRVLIRADGSLALRASAGGEKQVSRGELAGHLRQAQERDPKQAVVIAADRNVRYQAVLEVMDELQKQQVARIGLLVQQGR
ncbi:MAG: protein TolR [Rhodocyclales bacterium CG17_big_fil_post_rev_8_21_14_2_50_68_7]|nr:MAG: protein TolR [Betaproteobacteria bacterium CG2_30_68_42]PIV73300.1 MAG: protein TolR [Rhodocyclales bacterium CG17_big_fil_post_rev_8_21_14_2_50_68_7]PIX74337.1 MAG: protein TolR [Rhodocyclales bacterium CG_4_10_14_3_um_filter_68_10]PJA58318.1 MAG: protein TolR [Rhodocyclales bacterium CG_4_9_14_3_um_filter_68_10]